MASQIPTIGGKMRADAEMVCEERRRREDKLAQAFYRCTQVHDSGGKLVLVLHLVQWLTRKNPKKQKMIMASHWQPMLQENNHKLHHPMPSGWSDNHIVKWCG